VLGRSANHLYWMSRYIERAENTARILEISQRMALLPHVAKKGASEWQAVLEIAGDVEDYTKRYGDITANKVTAYLTLDRENHSSIWSTIRAARENAHAERVCITSEMWESLNATWLEVKDLTPAMLGKNGQRDFFDWIKERSHLFRGITFGTMLRDDAYHFGRLGTFVERSDNVARILDVKYHVLLPSVEDVGGAIDNFQWGALLRSVSGFRAYHRVSRHDRAAPRHRTFDPQRFDAALAAFLPRRDRRPARHAERRQADRSRASRRRTARLAALRQDRRHLPNRAARIPDDLPQAQQRALR
jgi:uncharacterized alpha-E superfamily protein